MRLFDLKKPNFEPRLHVIEANAGTGKTHSIVGMVLHLVLSGRHTVDSILVVTFTNAATNELIARIRQGLVNARKYFTAKCDRTPRRRADVSFDFSPFDKIDKTKALVLLGQALADFDRARICTIHSFCRQILQQNAFECGVPFGARLIESDTDLLQIAAADFFRNTIVNDNLSAAVACRKNWSPTR